MSKLRFRVVETAFKKKPVAVAVPAERPSEYFTNNHKDIYKMKTSSK